MIDLFNYQIKINANFFFFIHVNDSFLKQFCQKIFIDYNHILQVWKGSVQPGMEAS